MATVSERLQAFESGNVSGNGNSDTKEANADAQSPNSNPSRTSDAKPRRTRTSPKPNRTLPGTYSSRRRARSKDNRIDLSDDEMDINIERDDRDPNTAAGPNSSKGQQQDEHELKMERVLITEPQSSSSSGPLSEPPKDMVDLDLVAKSMSTRKLQTESASVPLTLDEITRKAKQAVKDKDKAGTNSNDHNTATEDSTKSHHHHHSKWAKLRNLFADPLAEEKKRQEELVLQQLKETDSTFSEEAYQIEKQTQDMFIHTKKEEAESIHTEKQRQKAENDAKLRKRLWEKIVHTTMAVFVGSVEMEKRQQEHMVLSHLRAMDSSVDEDDIRRQKEAQELFVEMKRRELERQRILEMEEVEKQRREAILAENMRLPEGLQAEDSSLMMQNSLILQGAKIQEALRSSLFQALDISEEGEEEGGEAGLKPAPAPIPLHIQKQMQQALLLQQLSENPDVEIDEEALRHSREIQESLIFYAKKTQRSSWLENYMPKRSTTTTNTNTTSIPQEVMFDDDGGSVGSRVSWLSGGFGGGSVSRPSWRTSFSKPAAATGVASKTVESDAKKEGSKNSWNLRSSMNNNNNNPKIGKDWAESNLHLAGHAESSENSDV